MKYCNILNPIISTHNTFSFDFDIVKNSKKHIVAKAKKKTDIKNKIFCVRRLAYFQDNQSHMIGNFLEMDFNKANYKKALLETDKNTKVLVII